MKQLKQLMIIDGRVADLAGLALSFPAGAEAVVINPEADGWQQVAGAVASHSGLDAVHVFSHGSAGTVWLGNTPLDAANIAGHQAQLAALGQALAPTGDVLLYGCEVGAGASGLALLASLADLTGADIAASDDPTGPAALGGDWTLEVRAGQVEAAPVSGADYRSLLAATEGQFKVGDGGGGGGGGRQPPVPRGGRAPRPRRRWRRR
jgi:hypothetical protein